MTTKVTRETLARDRKRRDREARALVMLYNDASYVLERTDARRYYAVIRLLRDEAARWER